MRDDPIAFRMPDETKKRLRLVAEAYYDGEKNVSSRFVRELLEAILHGDENTQRLGLFMTRLHEKLTGQLSMEFAATTVKPRSDKAINRRRKVSRRSKVTK